MSASRLPHCLFVYGTLKRGCTNHQRYLGLAEERGKAKFIGTGTTSKKFPMVVRPAHIAPPTRAPVLMDRVGTGHQIKGEIFRVDDSTLEAMDILEGVRSGFYYKRPTEVMWDNDGAVLDAITYFFPANEELLKTRYQESYTAEDHALYKPAPVNQKIVDLCCDDSKHILCTLEPQPLFVHCLRMLPGEDFLESLKAFAARHDIEAAAILSCVGSTGQTTLRPAGQPKPRVWDGKFEIVSLTGTLGKSGHHLHMSVSDAECAVFGGHVMKGCIVRTTAEVTLGLMPGLRFTRPLDSRTGYDELSIEAIEPATKRTCVGIGDS